MFSSPQKGFTLIELLVVIGILAVLATTTVLILNPAEFLAKSRDSVRVSDLKTLDKALQLFEVAILPNDGDPTKVYVSLPTSGAVRQDCSSSGTNEYPGLPPLPSGKNYSCAPSVSFRSVTGNGWIPVNFTSIPQGSPLAKLPIDPVNSHVNGTYYTYTMGGSWKLTALMEANKHDQSINDGGIFPGVYEIGTNLTLTSPGRDQGLVGYWPFDDGSGANIVGSLAASVDTYATTIEGVLGTALFRSGTSTLASIPHHSNNNFSINDNFTMSVWFYMNNDYPVSPDDVSRIFTKSQTTVNPFGMDLHTPYGNPRIRFGVRAGSNSDIVTNATTLTPGRWYNAVFVHRNIGSGQGNFKGYLDGVEVANRDHSRNFGSTATYVLGGSSALSGTGQNFRGAIDEARIYNRALSASEVASLYNAAK